MHSTDEYDVLRDVPPVPHGNTKRGLPFHRMGVGDAIETPPEEFARTSSARAHFQTKMRKQGKVIKITSTAVRDGDGNIVKHVFRRVK